MTWTILDGNAVLPANGTAQRKVFRLPARISLDIQQNGAALSELDRTAGILLCLFDPADTAQSPLATSTAPESGRKTDTADTRKDRKYAGQV